MTSAGSTTREEPFSWISLEGRTIVREIVEATVPQWTAPRDTQIDCWAHVLAGIPTILIASTGWGKTSAFFIPILVLKHLQKHPKPRVPKPPPSPVAFVVTPLIELGNAHALEISQFGLKAVSLCAESLEAAVSEGRDLFKEIRHCAWSIVLLSAERLRSDEIDNTIRDETFRDNIVVLGLDEVHVLVPWGKEFRQAYHQATIIRKRLPEKTALICVTATLCPGPELNGLELPLSIDVTTLLRFSITCFSLHNSSARCENVQLTSSRASNI